MKLKIKIIPIILVLVSLIAQIPFANAQTNILAVAGAGDTDTENAGIYSDWYNTTFHAGLCSSFQPNASGYLHNASLRISKGNTPTAILYIRIHEAVGTFGVDALPGESIAVDSLDSATLSSYPTFNWTEIDFTVDEPYLEQGHTYVISVVSEDNTGDVPQELSGTNSVRWAEIVRSGNLAQYANYEWHNIVAGYSYEFIIYVNTTNPAPSPTPVATYPSAGGGETYIDYLIGQLVNFLIPLLVMLLPALFLGLLTHWSKWPILIGLAIGSGLGYSFVPGFPVWLVILIAIGIAGFAYQSVRSGN